MMGGQCIICDREVPDYEAEYCCSGEMCGCKGLPIEPCLCEACDPLLLGRFDKIREVVQALDKLIEVTEKAHKIADVCFRFDAVMGVIDLNRSIMLIAIKDAIDAAKKARKGEAQ